MNDAGVCRTDPVAPGLLQTIPKSAIEWFIKGLGTTCFKLKSLICKFVGLKDYGAHVISRLCPSSDPTDPPHPSKVYKSPIRGDPTLGPWTLESVLKSMQGVHCSRVV